MYITNNRQDAYTNYTVRGEATLLDWLLSNLKESKSKVKATLKNSARSSTILCTTATGSASANRRKTIPSIANS